MLWVTVNISLHCSLFAGVERRGEVNSPCLFGRCSDANSACLSPTPAAVIGSLTAAQCLCRDAFYRDDDVCRQYSTLSSPLRCIPKHDLKIVLELWSTLRQY